MKIETLRRMREAALRQGPTSHRTRLLRQRTLPTKQRHPARLEAIRATREYQSDSSSTRLIPFTASGSRFPQCPRPPPSGPGSWLDNLSFHISGPPRTRG